MSRVYRSFLMDSTRWGWYEPRDTDVVISTAPKAGTTWTQRIVSSLIFNNELPDTLHNLSPWLEGRIQHRDVEDVIAVLEGQTHRRFIKSHLAADALPLSPSVRHIVVARDPRDTAVSLHSHYANRFPVLATLPPLTGPDVHSPSAPAPISDVTEFWRKHFTTSVFPWEQDGWPANSSTHHLSSWWRHRDEPNVLLLHYQDMWADLDGQMRRVAEFLDVPIPSEDRWQALVDSCRLDAMRAQAALVSPSADASFFGGGGRSRWRDAIPEPDHALGDAALRRLEPALRSWLTESDSRTG